MRVVNNGRKDRRILVAVEVDGHGCRLTIARCGNW